MTNKFITVYQQRIEAVLQQHLPAVTAMPENLHQAMHYAVLNNGKRIRPLLVYATGLIFGEPMVLFDIPAAAVELIHGYSLIHDDLPAMDNDDLRRGKPTCHKAFDEATAILAGDALQAHAFTLLANEGGLEAKLRNVMLTVLGEACGSSGMAGGQALDLAAVGQQRSLRELETMHQLKTGALIQASVRLSTLVVAAEQPVARQLDEFAAQIGLAFQIQDDILDIEGNPTLLGKRAGADDALNKPTYPALVGLDKAKQLAQTAYTKAIEALTIFGAEANQLRQLAAYMVQRDR